LHSYGYTFLMLIFYTIYVHLISSTYISTWPLTRDIDIPSPLGVDGSSIVFLIMKTPLGIPISIGSSHSKVFFQVNLG
jgi:hypothetical protein